EITLINASTPVYTYFNNRADLNTVSAALPLLPVFLFTLLDIFGRFRPPGAPEAVSARVGDDVTLGCSVDSHVPPEKMEKVVWKRPHQDVIVLLYKGGEVLHDSSHERYRGRAEFFPAEIHKGNFSLRLKEVRTEDEGDFMCEVHTSLLSASTTVLLQDLGTLACCCVVCGDVVEILSWYFLPTEMFHVSVPAVLLCLLALAVTVGLSFPVGTSLWKEPPVPSRTDKDQEENRDAGKEADMRTAWTSCPVRRRRSREVTWSHPLHFSDELTAW
uniref:Ig-like domain-containing protein n=1 Tax=Denticeps clupeoides TaxID=299321 RepID=A0AAY4DH97_9TELE